MPGRKSQKRHELRNKVAQLRLSRFVQSNKTYNSKFGTSVINHHTRILEKAFNEPSFHWKEVAGSVAFAKRLISVEESMEKEAKKLARSMNNVSLTPQSLAINLALAGNIVRIENLKHLVKMIELRKKSREN